MSKDVIYIILSSDNPDIDYGSIKEKILAKLTIKNMEHMIVFHLSNPAVTYFIIPYQNPKTNKKEIPKVSSLLRTAEEEGFQTHDKFITEEQLSNIDGLQYYVYKSGNINAIRMAPQTGHTLKEAFNEALALPRTKIGYTKIWALITSKICDKSKYQEIEEEQKESTILFRKNEIRKYIIEKNISFTSGFKDSITLTDIFLDLDKLYYGLAEAEVKLSFWGMRKVIIDHVDFNVLPYFTQCQKEVFWTERDKIRSEPIVKHELFIDFCYRFHGYEIEDGFETFNLSAYIKKWKHTDKVRTVFRPYSSVDPLITDDEMELNTFIPLYYEPRRNIEFDKIYMFFLQPYNIDEDESIENFYDENYELCLAYLDYLTENGLIDGVNESHKPLFISIVKNMHIIYYHIFYNICSGKEDKFTYLMNWYLHVLLIPSKKTEVGLIFTSPQGVGKTLINEAFAKLLPPDHYLSTSKGNDIMSRFTIELKRKLFLLFEEMFSKANKSMSNDTGQSSSQKAVLNNYKELITGEKFHLEEKLKTGYKEPNFANVICHSNDTNPLGDMDPSNRRFIVFAMNNGFKFSDLRDQYFSSLANALSSSNGLRLLLEAFLNTGNYESNYNFKVFPQSTEEELSKQYGYYSPNVVHDKINTIIKTYNSDIFNSPYTKKLMIHILTGEERDPENDCMFILPAGQISSNIKSGKQKKLLNTHRFYPIFFLDSMFLELNKMSISRIPILTLRYGQCPSGMNIFSFDTEKHGLVFPKGYIKVKGYEYLYILAVMIHKVDVNDLQKIDSFYDDFEDGFNFNCIMEWYNAFKYIFLSENEKTFKEKDVYIMFFNFLYKCTSKSYKERMEQKDLENLFIQKHVIGAIETLIKDPVIHKGCLTFKNKNGVVYRLNEMIEKNIKSLLFINNLLKKRSPERLIDFTFPPENEEKLKEWIKGINNFNIRTTVEEVDLDNLKILDQYLSNQSSRVKSFIQEFNSFNLKNDDIARKQLSLGLEQSIDGAITLAIINGSIFTRLSEIIINPSRSLFETLSYNIPDSSSITEDDDEEVPKKTKRKRVNDEPLPIKKRARKNVNLED